MASPKTDITCGKLIGNKRLFLNVKLTVRQDTNRDSAAGDCDDAITPLYRPCSRSPDCCRRLIHINGLRLFSNAIYLVTVATMQEVVDIIQALQHDAPLWVRRFLRLLRTCFFLGGRAGSAYPSRGQRKPRIRMDSGAFL